MFSEKDINDTYNSKVKLPESYFRKYEKLPPCPFEVFKHTWSGKDFPRNWCALDFTEWIEKYNISEIENLAYTCNTDPEFEYLSKKNIKNKYLLEYPPYDLHTIGSHFTEAFDFFLFNQTLEHLYNPFDSIKQIRKTMKKGGYVFTSVPTLNIPHMVPSHFNGFTPMGLAMLFKSSEFEVLEIGQWGNHNYICQLWGTHQWPDYDRLQNNGIVPNEEKNVCQTWILARAI
jgi:SAM-dependent methyltransferase